MRQTFYENTYVALYQSDARAVMAEMSPQSVHLVFTSPP